MTSHVPTSRTPPAPTGPSRLVTGRGAARVAAASAALVALTPLVPAGVKPVTFYPGLAGLAVAAVLAVLAGVPGRGERFTARLRTVWGWVAVSMLAAGLTAPLVAGLVPTTTRQASTVQNLVVQWGLTLAAASGPVVLAAVWRRRETSLPAVALCLLVSWLWLFVVLGFTFAAA
jgi:hypothetical protein